MLLYSSADQYQRSRIIDKNRDRNIESINLENRVLINELIPIWREKK